MSLDEAIDTLIEAVNHQNRKDKKPGWIRPVYQWKWYGRPGPFAATGKTAMPKEVDWAVYRAICRSSVAECEASHSEYVREAKRWSLRQSGIDPESLKKNPLTKLLFNSGVETSTPEEDPLF